MKQILLTAITILLVSNCSKTNLEKINHWLEKEDYEKLLEFSFQNRTKLTEEELYLSSVAVAKLENFLRKNKSEEKYSSKNYIQSLERKIGLKIKSVSTENGQIIQIEDVFHKSITQSKYYKEKSVLDKFIITAKTNEIFENSFLLTDILEIDPRSYLQEFKTICIESMKLGLPANLNETDKEKFMNLLHFLASKEETNLKTHYFITEGTNVNLRSGPGTENITVGKLNKEEVFQIDSDFNTTTIGNKTGKWIQIYVWSTDTIGWIFSPFLREANPDYSKAKFYEKTLSDKSSFLTIDFNNWNSEEIPSGFYGNYLETKKEIVDANVGFTIYPMGIEQAICTKLKKDLKKLEMAYIPKNSNDKLLLFYLKSVANTKSKTLVKISIWNEKIYFNSKILEKQIEKDKLQKISLLVANPSTSKIAFTLSHSNNPVEIQDTLDYETEEIQSWELCIPQGKKSSSKALLFSFNIY